jgi:hypothetical protein
MGKLDYESPVDFVDEMEVQQQPEPPSPKASSILYVTSAFVLFGGIMIPLLEMVSRQQNNMPDTIIELLEWNPFSQLGVTGIVLGLFLFWLGLMVDRRGA